MAKLMFRLGQAVDGRCFGFLTDQDDVEDLFDNGYKVAYRELMDEKGTDLPGWRHQFTAVSLDFDMLPESAGLPAAVQEAFNNMVETLIKGVDILFCDYNLAVEGDLPMCNDVMDRYRSTDFVLFSCADIVGVDPSVQPYYVAYAMPRYASSANKAMQHRIYCKTDAVPFRQAIKSIIHQRRIDNLAGGHIRDGQDLYVNQPNVDQSAATKELNQFVAALSRPEATGMALTHEPDLV